VVSWFAGNAFSADDRRSSLPRERLPRKRFKIFLENLKNVEYAPPGPLFNLNDAMGASHAHCRSLSLWPIDPGPR
jgi:hypothetical protein